MSAGVTVMAGEVLSIAIFKAVAGKTAEAVSVLRELDQHLRTKGYSRDILYEDAGRPGRFVLLRYWKSLQHRTDAHQDVEIHDYWGKLAHLIEVEEVFERLEEPK